MVSRLDATEETYAGRGRDREGGNKTSGRIMRQPMRRNLTPVFTLGRVVLPRKMGLPPWDCSVARRAIIEDACIMPRELDIKLENLTYTLRFARPAFHLWGRGGAVIGPLYDALSAFGVTLGNILVHSAPNAAEPVVTVWVRGNSTVKFAFDRLEFALNNYDQEFFEQFPKLFRDCTSWLRREPSVVRFASHSFGYFCHATAKDSTAKVVLESINPRTLRSGGSSTGTGSIFQNSVPDKNWTTRLWFEESRAFPGAIFIALSIDTLTEELDYEATLVDARAYFRSVLAELDLTLPELSE